VLEEEEEAEEATLLGLVVMEVLVPMGEVEAAEERL
jgi:hypothetical protein